MDGVLLHPEALSQSLIRGHAQRVDTVGNATQELLSVIDIWMQGRTCLMLAVENCRAAIVKTLVLEGADVLIRDQEV